MHETLWMSTLIDKPLILKNPMETLCLQLNIPVAGWAAVTNSFHPAMLGTDNHDHRTLQHHLMSFFYQFSLARACRAPTKAHVFLFFAITLP